MQDIPLREINSLIPRITSAINDIDVFKTMLAGGHADGSLPNWDALLQRYSMLLGRLNALSSSVATVLAPSTVPTLARFALHPLNPLHPEADVMAQETLFQAMNTMPLPGSVQDDTSRLRDLRQVDDGAIASTLQALKKRLNDDQLRCAALGAVIQEKEDEVELNMRIEDDDAVRSEPYTDSLRIQLDLFQPRRDTT